MNESTPPRRPPGRRVLLVSLDRCLAVVVLGAAVAFAFRPTIIGGSDLIPRGPLVVLVALAVGVLVAIALWRVHQIAGPGRQVILRVGLVLLTATVAGMVATRYHIAAREHRLDELWPPHQESVAALKVTELPTEDRVAWALWLAAHADDMSSAGPPVIPADWPFPEDIEIAIRDDGRSREVVAASTDPEIWCHAQQPVHGQTGDPEDPIPTCAAGSPPGELVLQRPRRIDMAAPAPIVGAPQPGWRQHRADALHSGVASDSTAIALGWVAASGTPVRAGVSVIHGTVLIGGHATGLLVALDLASGERRWTSRAPNWIHQNPVSDGRVVAVGFGDQDKSFLNAAPSGVAVFDFENGHRRWTAFEATSVMTSPVIHDSTLVYVTASGLVRRRSLVDGRLLGELEVPGGAIMGPPALHGDALVTTLDVDAVCAIDMARFAVSWCRRFPGMRRIGHGSPAIVDDAVIFTAVTTATTAPLRESLQLPVMLKLKLIRSVLFPMYWDANYPGQVTISLDLASGRTRWVGTHEKYRREFGGHMAGTALVRGTQGFVVLPVANVVQAFDVADGSVRWTAEGLAARGAPVMLDSSTLLIAGRSGTLRTLDVATGETRCEVHRDTGWDRAGPALGGGLAIFANLAGEIEAIPLQRLLDCTAEGASRPAGGE